MHVFSLLVVLCTSAVSLSLAKINYPKVRRDESVVDDYYGTKVPDPYRWLENTNSEEVKQFIEAQNKITEKYFEDSPVPHDILYKKLLDIYNYPKYGSPSRQGDKYYFAKNDGLQNQPVYYSQDDIKSGTPKVFFDPNKLSEDGTVALNDLEFSENGKLATMAISKSGSDWREILIKNVETGENFPEVLKNVKFTDVEWTKDSKGFFYGRYDKKAANKTISGAETVKDSDQKIYYHRVGTSQAEDVMVIEFPENPNWLIGTSMSDCGNYLFVSPSAGGSESMLYFANLNTQLKNGFTEPIKLTPIVEEWSEIEYVTNEGPAAIFKTNKNAPNYKIVVIDLNNVNEQYWSTLVAEDPDRVINFVTPINNDKLIFGYLHDVKTKLELRHLKNGTFLQEIPLDVGTVYFANGKKEHSEFFFKFVSFLTPGNIYRVDMSDSSKPYEPELIQATELNGFDTSKFVTKQLFYESKDGTKVPMFIVHKKGLTFNGNSPVWMYAYGGFDISILPTFRQDRLVLLNDFDGIYAVPNIRGGGEYGVKWHEGGQLLNKQNVFDDFQAAAEYLIKNKYTRPEKIMINGGSNGGLLVSACINQRPDLFGAGIAQVGVHDLLRFQKFTIGHAWCKEYGCSDDGNITHFENLYKLSPLHNIRVPKEEGVQYPPILVTTADFDDRVVPSHSYKYVAQLQYTLGKVEKQTNPLLLKVDSKAGHGAGKPTSKKIKQFTDFYTFMVKALDMKMNS